MSAVASEPVTVTAPILATRAQRCRSRFCGKWIAKGQEAVRRSDIGWVHVECSTMLDEIEASRPEPEPDRETYSVEIRLPPDTELLNFGELELAYPGARLESTEKGVRLYVPVDADNLVKRTGELLVALGETLYVGEWPAKFGVVATGDEDE